MDGMSRSVQIDAWMHAATRSMGMGALCVLCTHCGIPAAPFPTWRPCTPGSDGALACAEVTLNNEMSKTYRITEASFVLDGALRYDKEARETVRNDVVPILAGPIAPGNHSLHSKIYLRSEQWVYGGVIFVSETDHAFTVKEGATTILQVVARELGNVHPQMSLSVGYVERVR
jgi:hypothetical protein